MIEFFIAIYLILSQLVDCAPATCDFLGGVVVPAGEDECCPTCGCRWGNNTYRVGESFPAGDGCNQWYEFNDFNLCCTVGVIIMLHVYIHTYTKYGIITGPWNPTFKCPVSNSPTQHCSSCTTSGVRCTLIACKIDLEA